ncbi:MAG: pentapeptide repeat-containing protein, partial [Leptolyngbyaceae cyanobacterium bins.59]|nr:pentapeptide repeat-containing protein [Leptolyngbyaceae cyanobacterium bins.59]
AAPLLVSGFYLYELAIKGRSAPKRWFGVRVVTPSGAPPGLVRAVIREGVGRWGIPLGVAYAIWHFTGAFPDLGILAALSGVFLLGEATTIALDGRRRTLHDRLSGTFVIDSSYSRWNPQNGFHPATHEVYWDQSGEWQSSPQWTDEDDLIAAIVLTPEVRYPRRSLWLWVRQHPGLTLLIVSLSSIAMVLGTFVGTQVYIQGQANQREFKQQDNEVFLALVSKLAPNATSKGDDRQGAILALGTVRDPRAIPLLVDLLGQVETATLIETTQQALVNKGPEALPYLRRMNQALRNDLDSLRRGTNQQEQAIAALRLRATQRAIAKILTIYSGQIHDADLSRIDLGQSLSGPAQFTLILDQADLSGLHFRSTNLIGASLKGARFYGPGEDQYWGTYDDWMANLSGADLKAANLTGAFLSNISMNRVSLIRAVLNRADMSRSRLSGANFSSAKLIRANLRQAILEGAILTGADLANANLTQTNLRNARLVRVSALGAQLRSAELTGSDWRGADLSGADLGQANLQRADLSSSRLVGANLSGTQLQNANLRGADLSLTDLRGAELKGADFLGATFVPLTINSPDQFIKRPPTPNQTVYLQGVNFTQAKNLNSEQLNFICKQGGQHPRCH